MPDPAVRLDATVIGRVQGVGFRYFVAPRRRWISGSMAGSPTPPTARSGASRRVRGSSSRSLLDRLRDGPAAAIVERVSEAWMPATGTLGPFAVRSGAHRGD